jgi:hypothetical protein
MQLAPGRYQLRVGVETGSGDVGSVFYDLDVGFSHGPLTMSGMLLASLAQAHASALPTA